MKNDKMTDAFRPAESRQYRSFSPFGILETVTNTHCALLNCVVKILLIANRSCPRQLGLTRFGEYNNEI